MKKEKMVTMDIELDDKTYAKLIILANKYNLSLEEMILKIIREEILGRKK